MRYFFSVFFFIFFAWTAGPASAIVAAPSIEISCVFAEEVRELSESCFDSFNENFQFCTVYRERNCSGDACKIAVSCDEERSCQMGDLDIIPEDGLTYSTPEVLATSFLSYDDDRLSYVNLGWVDYAEDEISENGEIPLVDSMSYVCENDVEDLRTLLLPTIRDWRDRGNSHSLSITPFLEDTLYAGEIRTDNVDAAAHSPYEVLGKHWLIGRGDPEDFIPLGQYGYRDLSVAESFLGGYLAKAVSDLVLALFFIVLFLVFFSYWRKKRSGDHS